MEVLISFKAQVPNIQKGTALRDRLAAELDNDEVVTVINSSMAQVTQTYDVVRVVPPTG